jgi:hypothetical protein
MSEPELYIEPGSSAEVANWRSWKFNGEDVETALQVLAGVGGVYKKAERVLAEIGLEILAQTLSEWANHKFPDRYHAILRERGREIEELAASKAREAVIKAQTAQNLAIEQTIERLEANDPRVDPSQAAQRMAVVMGINNDHNLKLTGRPTQITEHRDPNEILRSLGAIAGLVKVENEAEGDVQED